MTLYLRAFVGPFGASGSMSRQGSQPAASGGQHPEVVAVMGELGIDVSDRQPRKLTTELAEWADVVVTMGCGDECPYYPGKRYVDWELEDPAGRPIDEVRPIRDEIERRVRELMDELGVGPSGLPRSTS